MPYPAATNGNLAMERLLADIPAGTPLLLHACCGPCLSAVAERLAGHFALTVYFYNPNIAPLAEYERRLGAVRLLLAKMPNGSGIRVLEGAYDENAFKAAARGLEAAPEGGGRCAACFGLRLGEAAKAAAEEGFGWFATTLSVSPHKNAALLNKLGDEAAQKYGVRFLPADFKKKNGYHRSVRLSQQYGLYRQTYCGCLFSAGT